MKFGLFYKNQVITYSASSAIILINIPTSEVYLFSGIQYTNTDPINYIDYTMNTWKSDNDTEKIQMNPSGFWQVTVQVDQYNCVPVLRSTQLAQDKLPWQCTWNTLVEGYQFSAVINPESKNLKTDPKILKNANDLENIFVFAKKDKLVLKKTTMQNDWNNSPAHVTFITNIKDMQCWIYNLARRFLGRFSFFT